MNILDTLAAKPLLELTQEEEDAIDEALYAETGIGFGHENFDDFELTLYHADGVSTDYLHWPIPGLRTLGQAVQLARMLKAANTPGHLYRVLTGERTSQKIVNAYAAFLEEQSIAWPAAAKVKPSFSKEPAKKQAA